jgi:hypothetical protein
MRCFQSMCLLHPPPQTNPLCIQTEAALSTMSGACTA